jgi:hypothetical protein
MLESRRRYYRLVREFMAAERLMRELQMRLIQLDIASSRPQGQRFVVNDEVYE